MEEGRLRVVDRLDPRREALRLLVFGMEVALWLPWLLGALSLYGGHEFMWRVGLLWPLAGLGGLVLVRLLTRPRTELVRLHWIEREAMILRLRLWLGVAIFAGGVLWLVLGLGRGWHLRLLDDALALLRTASPGPAIWMLVAWALLWFRVIRLGQRLLTPLEVSRFWRLALLGVVGGSLIIHQRLGALPLAAGIAVMMLGAGASGLSRALVEDEQLRSLRADALAARGLQLLGILWGPALALLALLTLTPLRAWVTPPLRAVTIALGSLGLLLIEWAVALVLTLWLLLFRAAGQSPPIEPDQLWLGSSSFAVLANWLWASMATWLKLLVQFGCLAGLALLAIVLLIGQLHRKGFLEAATEWRFRPAIGAGTPAPAAPPATATRALPRLRWGSLDPNERVRRIYVYLLRLGASQGYGWRASQTPLQQEAALSALFPALRGEIGLIAHSYLRVRYGSATLAPTELAALEAAWKRILQATSTDERRLQHG